MLKNERDFENYIRTPDEMKLTPNLGIPIVKGVKCKHPERLDLLEYHYCSHIPQAQRKSKTVHFFLSDYLFVRVWNRADDNVKLLKQFGACFSPDFSQYTDMPKAMKIWQHYKKMWVSAYWQLNGIRVIPTACWSDEDSYEYCFEGMPKESCIAVSSLGVMNNSYAQGLFRQGYEEMKRQLNPSQIIFYGKKPDWVEDEIIHQTSSTDKRFGALDAKKQYQTMLNSAEEMVKVDTLYKQTQNMQQLLQERMM